MYRILTKQALTPVTHLYVIDAPLVAAAARPGQFVILRVGAAGERIPVTITDFDAAEGTVTIVVQTVGKTTHWLSTLSAGDALQDFAGPLGRPAELPAAGRVCLVGGGFGSAAIYTLARELQARGVAVLAVVGARSRDLLILTDRLQAVVDALYPCTDDGSLGYRGLVTGQLAELIAGGTELQQVIAVGPMPMMRAVAEVTRPHGIYTQVSLDPIMVDGTGMCGACRVSVAQKTRFACVDGPFFDAHQVDFAEGARRVKMYKQQEAEAMARWQAATTGCAGALA